MSDDFRSIPIERATIASIREELRLAEEECDARGRTIAALKAENTELRNDLVRSSEDMGRICWVASANAAVSDADYRKTACAISRAALIRKTGGAA